MPFRFFNLPKQRFGRTPDIMPFRFCAGAFGGAGLRPPLGESRGPQGHAPPVLGG